MNRMPICPDCHRVQGYNGHACAPCGMFTPEPCPECQATSPCEHYAPEVEWGRAWLTADDRRIWNTKED